MASRGQRAFLTGLAGGASYLRAIEIAAAVADPFERTRWARAASASAPFEVLRTQVLLPRACLRFVDPNVEPSLLAVRAAAVLEAMSPSRSGAPLQLGAFLAFLTAACSLAVREILEIFVIPVFAKLGIEAKTPLAARFLLGAGLLLAIGAGISGLFAFIEGRRGTLSSRQPPAALALGFAHAAQLGKLPCNSVLLDLSRTFGVSRAIGRFYRVGAQVEQLPALLTAWSSAGLLGRRLDAAAQGLLASPAILDPALRLARMARLGTSPAGAVQERLLSAAIVLIALGALLVLAQIHLAIAALGGTV